MVSANIPRDVELNLTVIVKLVPGLTLIGRAGRFSRVNPAVPLVRVSVCTSMVFLLSVLVRIISRVVPGATLPKLILELDVVSMEVLVMMFSTSRFAGTSNAESHD